MQNEHEPSPPSSVHVTHFENKAVNSLFLPSIQESYGNLKKLLPTLPEVMNISFGTNYDYGEDGVTGNAMAKDAFMIGIRVDQEDRAPQFERIKSLVFHEGYHIAQGFYNANPCSAIEAAIYEGCATLFEREYAGASPRWADYSAHSEETLRSWFEQIKTRRDVAKVGILRPRYPGILAGL